MSFVAISRDMATLLVALRSWPNVTFDELRAMPEWHQARQRGWILDSGELSVSGWRHAGGEIPTGIPSMH